MQKWHYLKLGSIFELMSFFLIRVFMYKCFIGLTLLLATFFGFASQKETITVIAVEYPPYTSEHMPDNGVTFKLLKDYSKQYFERDIQPLFLPPARAQAVMQSGNWCLSFIPPVDSSNVIPISDAEIILSFFRFKTEGEFKWQSLSELKGQTVAMLRTLGQGEVAKKMTQAGMEIVRVDSLSQGMNMVLKKRVDYWFTTQNTPQALNADEAAQKNLQFAETPLMVVQPRIFYSERCKKELNL